ncbi:hypothetical protein SETIT_3G211500v2 [Setaria italica]|uniref:Uncharacterized protein n=1 Tax=Setaria italica TaxID=4555 RepID=A0A368QHA7_SETIT|nr:hypothetical protein SETIT_3G211500v2 [Setaria italica]
MGGHKSCRVGYSAEGDIALQHPGAAVIFKGIRAEKGRLLLGHLDVAQLPLADPIRAFGGARQAPAALLQSEDSAKRHPVLQRPAAVIIIKGKGTEHERLLPGHLGVAQPPLADPHVAVPALYPLVLPTLHGLCHAARRQLDEAEVRASRPAKASTSRSIFIRRASGSGDGNPTSFSHSPKPPHDEPPLLPVAILAEHGDSVPVRRPVGAFRLGEDAHLREPLRLLRAVDVREAEHLATEGVADESPHVDVQVDASQLALLSAAVRGDDGGGAAYIHEGEEEEAVAARGFEDAAIDYGYVFAAGVAAGRVGEVGGDDEVGEARGLGEPERRARRRRFCQPRERMNHSPRRARGGRGEAAAEAAGDGGGEAKDAPERHLGEAGERR